MLANESSSDYIACSMVCHHADKSAGSGSDSAASGVICASRDLRACDDRKLADVWSVVRGGRPPFFGAGGGWMARAWMAAAAYAAFLAASVASAAAWWLAELAGAPMCLSTIHLTVVYITALSELTMACTTWTNFCQS